MGIYDRDYSQDSYRPSHGSGHMRFGFPPLTPAVKWLLIINLAVFVLSSIPRVGQFFAEWFAVLGTKGSLNYSWQVWRYISYQFLHEGMMHILFNMLGLFFLGPVLERSWGTAKFAKFYLSCGAVGGIFFQLLCYAGLLGNGFMVLVGASGAILGMLAACAILFPQFVVFIIVFPVPIRIASIIFTVIYLANLIAGGDNAGGDAAHLAGMAAGAIYVFWMRYRLSDGIRIPWPKKKVEDIRFLHEEVDLILDKVAKNGISSLSRREKNILKQATKLEQMKSQL
jgi:membrane associated rhomboid family serine protease